MRKRMRAAALAVVLGFGVLGALAGCEVVPPPAVDTSAPALLSVVGKPADLAVKLLQGAGYRVAVVDGHGDTTPASASRLVVGQDPDGGAKVAAGRLVTITLGK